MDDSDEPRIELTTADLEQLSKVLAATTTPNVHQVSMNVSSILLNILADRLENQMAIVANSPDIQAGAEGMRAQIISLVRQFATELKQNPPTFLSK